MAQRVRRERPSEPAKHAHERWHYACFGMRRQFTLKGDDMNQAQSHSSALRVEPQEGIANTRVEMKQPRCEGHLPMRNGAAVANAAAALVAPTNNARTWTQAADWEARNALQVILSGSEILLDNFFGRLSPAQKKMLETVLASARHLSGIIATLSNPEEIIIDEPLANLHREPARAALSNI